MPVDLRLHNKDEPRGEQLLLQYPPTGADGAVYHGAVSDVPTVDTNDASMAIRVIWSSTEEYLGILGIALIKRETALRTIPGLHCGDGQLASLVDLEHICSFVLPLLFIILNNAKRIYPEVWDPKSSSYVYSIGKRLWDEIQGDPLPERGKCFLCGA